MADTKISALADGGAFLDTDEFVVARAGDNVRIAGSKIADPAKTASISELVAGAQGTDLNSAAAGSAMVFVAPFACKVVAASVVMTQGSIAASDTNYYTVTIRRWRADASVNVASKTTKVTGGEAITQRQDWNFDAVTFDATNQVLQKGDSIDFAFLVTGTPPSLAKPFCQIRYEPV